jgi:hypothetical protein
MRDRVPFAERGGAVRGLLDLASGCYPAFLFGGSIGDQLPVFHFHEVTREWLEPRLQFLVDNGYRTVTCDEIARLVIDRIRPGPRAIALTFDDAWESAWRIAMPLLAKYGLRAVLFVIPARLIDEDAEASPFVTWSQLRSMQSSGVFDIQSHTRSHAMIFSGTQVVDFVTPEYAREPLLNRPIRTMNGRIETVDADALGTPLHQRRSRMSDALRVFADDRVAERCRAYVAQRGGAAYFARPGWRRELASAAREGRPRVESEDERHETIRRELVDGRALLNQRLGTNTVKHVAMPWGVAGKLTRRLIAETGHETAFAERPGRRRTVRAADDRFELMRLSGRFLTCLPGRGRQWFFTTVR